VIDASWQIQQMPNYAFSADWKAAARYPGSKLDIAGFLTV
jgi:hypothetical protein